MVEKKEPRISAFSRDDSAPENKVNESEQCSAIQRLAERLRAYSASVPSGTFLGSQTDLLQKFGVSRTTLKAATALLVQDNVIVARRGMGGGYFSASPTNTSIARNVATLLNAPHLGVRELMEASKPIRSEVVRLAALRGADAERRQLADLIVRDESQDGSDLVAFLVLERTYREVFSRMANSRILQMFAGILSDLINLGEAGIDLFGQKPERIQPYRVQRIRMARSVIEGDARVAQLHALQLSEMAFQWLDEHERSGGGQRFEQRLSKSLSQTPEI